MERNWHIILRKMMQLWNCKYPQQNQRLLLKDGKLSKREITCS